MVAKGLSGDGKDGIVFHARSLELAEIWRDSRVVSTGMVMRPIDGAKVTAGGDLHLNRDIATVRRTGPAQA
ncbi:MAG: hypothetical protein COW54_12550 [Rhodobacteraceae bacterium CG17_big_fil_post_rev_8_21_14_2_50_63_15]|nr:MAG: hypothetical protein COW54_12550 [Rhodobacteraceae bacterium CG17_big_fil_post_rev_8_21_14_2_50_63_15]